MAYIEDNDIFDATDGGLQIILSYYPDASKVVHKNAKRFKLRADEKTASASLKLLDNGVWVVTDFGDDQKPMNCIMVCAKEERISYADACQLLGSRYGIKGAEKKVVKPKLVERPLNPDEQKGDFDYSAKKNFTKAELAMLGPRVNEVHCTQYRLFSVESYTKCYDNKAITVSSTEEYPIFIFDYGTWQKIYEPNSEDKGYRFKYAGSKPKKYLFGLDVVKKEFEKLKKAYEESYGDEDDDEDDSAKKKKKDCRLDHVFIMSGGSDALNIRSFGFYPVWTNSETEQLEWSDYKDLKKMAKEIIYVGDLDATGIKQAVAFGLKYIDVKLLWLPKKLRELRDQRGNPKKDFKDYVQTYYRSDDATTSFNSGLRKLIDNSLPMQFWTEYISKDKRTYNISNTRLYHFLEHMGFGRYESPNFKDGYIYIRKDGNIIRVLRPDEIESFVNDFLEERGLPTDLRDYVYNSPRLGEKSFSKLKKMEVDFTTADRETQYFFFPNTVWKIQAGGITELKQGAVDKYIWEDKIIDFNVKKDAPHFEITTDEDGDMDIKVLRNDNMFFNYLINTSRVHWREELEEKFEGRPAIEALNYFNEHKFNIAGPNLTPDQALEHKQHLINKMFSIGYMLHNYKNYNKPWAVFAMDNKVSEEGESHGGSGKSLCYGFLNKIIKRRVYLKGRDPKLTQNDFIYHEVTEDTDYILIDDATQFLNFNFFFSEITGSLKVNPKNGSPFEVPFEKSPKFVFTSNFALREMDPSTARRILYTVFSDYYHSSDDEYNQIRKVSDDFGGRNLFTDFTDKDYNDYYNFCAQCVQFFLSSEIKVNPPMDNVTKRNLKAEMGDVFLGWAEAFFLREDIHNVYLYRDKFFSKEEAFEDFSKSTKLTKWTANKFKKAVKAYCTMNGWIFNPKEYAGAGGRIVRKMQGVTTEVIYISTVNEEAIINNMKIIASDDDDATVFDQE